MNTRTSFLALLLALTAFIGTARAAEPEDKRHPVPAAADQKKAEATVRDIFKADYASRDPKARAAFAKKLLQTGIETTDNLAARYVLFREAADIAARAGDIGTCTRAIAETAASFDIDELVTRGKTLAAAGSAASDPKALRTIVTAFLALADDAVAIDNYDVAARAATAAERYARKARDAALLADAKAKLKDVGRLRAAHEKVAKARQVLATNPESPAANQTVGEFLCFVKGNWPEGLPHLARGSDEALKALATAELAKPKDADGQVALGDQWRAAAGNETNEHRKSSLLARAAHWYEAALPDLTGLAKAKLEKQLQEVQATHPGIQPGIHPTRGAVSKEQVLAARKAGVPPIIEIDLGRGVKMKLVYIPPGEFLMGSPEGEGRPDEHPQHRVRITKGFYMGVTEVTQAQWYAVMGTEPWKGQPNAGKSPRAAANYISWNDAVEFCKRLSARTRRGSRLPTEAEWEYACRAGSTTRFYFGDDASKLGEYVWYIANTYNVQKGYPQEVGQKKPNRWGLYDMIGNVWEWCMDLYAVDYYANSEKENPQGPRVGNLRVKRGGGWGNGPEDNRCGAKLGLPPTSVREHQSFRVAYSTGNDR